MSCTADLKDRELLHKVQRSREAGSCDSAGAPHWPAALPRFVVSAFVLLATVASAVGADEPVKGAGEQGLRAAALPRVAYRSFWPQERYVRQFAEAGVELVMIFPANTICTLKVPYSNYPQIWTGPDQYNWESLDDHIGDVLKWNPQAKLMVMIDLNTPEWWVKLHHKNSYHRMVEALLRADYQRDMKQYVRKFLEHTESKYKDKIVAYYLACGCCTEWFHVYKGDPGPLQQKAYAEFMKRPDIKVPEDRDKSTHPDFFDPVADADKIAFWRQHHRLVADAILDFAGEARQVTSNRAEIGLYFGYIVALGKNQLLYFGHLDYDRVFRSPLIDAVLSPADYRQRQGGQTGGFQFCPDAVLAGGNRIWHEVDHTTYCLKDSTEVAAQRRTAHGKHFDLRSPAEAVGVLRREFALAMTTGSHMWWFDMFGGWFDDPLLMGEIKHMTQLADQLADTKPSRAEVAVFVDADSMYYVNGESSLGNTLIRGLQFVLFKAGVPWRFYSLPDLEKLDTSALKVAILPNLFAVTPEKRKLLEEKLLRDGKTIVLPFAPGIITDGKYDPANIEKLTDVQVENFGDRSQPQEVIYKDRGEWTSVFVRQPEWTTPMLRDILREAGVHIYCDEDDAFYANDELIALHSAEGGRRTFRLPEPRIVTELFEGRTVSDSPVAEFTEEFAPMETRLYRLQGGGQD